MKPEMLLHGIRFIDSFFPSGGYAFSFGLEAAVQGGAVANPEQLRRYIDDALRYGVARREAVACGCAHDAVLKEDVDVAGRVDGELDAMHPASESRLASRQMGRQIVRVAVGQFRSAVLSSYAKRVEWARSPGHAAVALGVTLAAAGWKKEHAIAALMYQTAVGYVSAAMKLLPVGQHEAQSLLAGWTPRLGALAADAAKETLLQSWTPVQDVYAMRHATLTTRLFRS